MSDKEIYREITRYIDGELSGNEIDSLWEKFVDNPEYYKWFETELHLRDLAKEAEKSNITSIDSVNGAKPERNNKSMKGWFYAVAAIIIVSIGLQFYSVQDTVSIHPLSISQIEIDEMSGTDIMRSDEVTASFIDVEISRGLTLAYEGEYEEADAKFKSILMENLNPEQEARVMMNLGILHYNMANFEDAARYFEAASNSEEMNKFFVEKAWWFLGNAYLNLELLEEARDAVYKVYSTDGRFAGQAENLLEKMDGESE
ncbi:tetratricopeptide repeat protein [Rhodohalobacter halophilus]|uniref:tetratricopeptide repeat protein n=1 Tax=Rhodohalobacter halophilus TaxID=1812810 RepID=UPI00083F64A2|nr:tetratricopeptide repeat protein [Rhodohalobacter halophilus]